MVIKPVVRRRQCGATLIEFMISSILGVIVIGSVGSVFMSGQNIASEKSPNSTAKCDTLQYQAANV
ncbi:MAG: PilW family protein, partial [Vibrio toranzoniae]